MQQRMAHEWHAMKQREVSLLPNWLYEAMEVRNISRRKTEFICQAIAEHEPDYSNLE
jgi:hypothetical protein